MRNAMRGPWSPRAARAAAARRPGFNTQSGTRRSGRHFSAAAQGLTLSRVTYTQERPAAVYRRGYWRGT